MRNVFVWILAAIGAVCVLGFVVGAGFIYLASHQLNDQSAKYKASVAQVELLSMKVQVFMLDNGHPPKQLKFLVTAPGDASMWNGPYASESDLKDPFGNKFGYKVPGNHGLAFDLIFYGRDGKAGGDKLDRDVGNWE